MPPKGKAPPVEVSTTILKGVAKTGERFRDGKPKKENLLAKPPHEPKPATYLRRGKSNSYHSVYRRLCLTVPYFGTDSICMRGLRGGSYAQNTHTLFLIKPLSIG